MSTKDADLKILDAYIYKTMTIKLKYKCRSVYKCSIDLEFQYDHIAYSQTEREINRLKLS